MIRGDLLSLGHVSSQCHQLPSRGDRDITRYMTKIRKTPVRVATFATTADPGASMTVPVWGPSMSAKVPTGGVLGALHPSAPPKSYRPLQPGKSC